MEEVAKRPRSFGHVLAWEAVTLYLCFFLFVDEVYSLLGGPGALAGKLRLAAFALLAFVYLATFAACALARRVLGGALRHRIAAVLATAMVTPIVGVMFFEGAFFEVTEFLPLDFDSRHSLVVSVVLDIALFLLCQSIGLAVVIVAFSLFSRLLRKAWLMVRSKTNL